MVEYGCNVANKFGFMSDDDEFEDPQQLIVKAAKIEAERAAAQKKAEKVAALAAKAPKPAQEGPKPTGKENSRPVAAERGRGGRGRGRGGPPRTPREGGDVADRFGEGGRGRGAPRGRGGPRPFRGRGGNVNTAEEGVKDVSFEEGAQTEVSAEGGRGRRGGRGAPFGGRGRGGRGRQFDRQSGSDRTGVRGVEKKDGHGKGNWGDAKDELAGETEPVAEEQPQEPEVPREKTAEELEYEAQLAEFAKMKTLKEFKACQKGDDAGFKVRKAGEGAQENFGKLVPLQKESIEDKEEEIIVVRKESNKKVLNIDIQFTEAGRGGGGGGSRGAPRGGRGGPRGAGRGAARGGPRSHGPSHFDVSSEEFPALGAK